MGAWLVSYDIINSKVSDDVMGKLEVFRSEPLTQGQISKYKGRYLPEGAAALLLNVDLSDPFRPSKRDGYLVLGDDQDSMEDGIDAGVVGDRIAGAGFLRTSYGTDFFFVCFNEVMAATYFRSDVSNGGAWDPTTGDVFAPGTEEVVVFQANDHLLAIPGASVNVFAIDSSGEMFDGADTNASPPHGAVWGCYAFDRAWLLKQGTSSSSPQLHYSQLLPEAATVDAEWNRNNSSPTSVGGYVSMGADKGGAAMVCVPWGGNQIAVFLGTSIESFQLPSVNALGDPLNFGIRRVLEPHVGTCAKYSVISYGNELIFVDQFVQLRSFLELVNQEQQGIASRPLSDNIADEIPGRVNKSHRHKMRCAIQNDLLHVAYPRDDATECNYEAVMDMKTRRWWGIRKLKRPIGYYLQADIRAGAADELWFTDGGSGGRFAAQTAMYRMDAGTFTDNGEAIVYDEITRAIDVLTPENIKTAEWLELEAKGDDGAEFTASVQADEDEGWEQLPITLPIGSVGGSYPLAYNITYPITPGFVGLQRLRQTMHPEDGDRRARQFQLRFTEATLGKRAIRADYRMFMKIEAWQPEEN